MRERVSRVLRVASLALLAVVAAQVYFLVKSQPPLHDLSADLSAAEAGKSESPPDAGATSPRALPPPPEKLKKIESSGIFGLAPPKKEPPPALLGIADEYAMIAAPGGPPGLVREGGELRGVKVLRIGVNRVLIEYQGKQQELTIFSGLGSSPLSPQEKPEEAKETTP